MNKKISNMMKSMSALKIFFLIFIIYAMNYDKLIKLKIIYVQNIISWKLCERK